MNPRFLQNSIHQDFRTDSGIWINYKSTITGDYAGSNHQDLNDHLIREYNKKIINLGQPTGLLFSPYDGGYRFLGSI